MTGKWVVGPAYDADPNILRNQLAQGLDPAAKRRYLASILRSYGQSMDPSMSPQLRQMFSDQAMALNDVSPDASPFKFDNGGVPAPDMPGKQAGFVSNPATQLAQVLNKRRNPLEVARDFKRKQQRELLDEQNVRNQISDASLQQKQAAEDRAYEISRRNLELSQQRAQPQLDRDRERREMLVRLLQSAL